MTEQRKALGMIETVGFTSLIPALDECVKAANVEVIKYERADAGIVTGYIVGDVASVHAGIEAGVRQAKKLGGFRASKVIAKPDLAIGGLFNFPNCKSTDRDKSLQQKSLQELRKIARSYSGFPLKGKQISYAKKEELINAILSFERGGE